MKYVQINAYANGWANSVIFKKHQELQMQGHESYVFWARGEHDQDEYMVKIASYPEVCLDALQTRLDGRAGFHSKRITKRLLKRLDTIDPDIVHLHILLGYYMNVEMLFNWLAKHHCQVIWTLHDCWAFTGHCIHFSHVKCMQWKTRCADDRPCPQTNTYPKTLRKTGVDKNFDQKRHLFSLLPTNRMRLITPSNWLCGLVADSFLSKYSIQVAPNAIDSNIYKPTFGNFRIEHNLQGKFIILGVASTWSKHKGLSDFIRLSQELDNEYAIVLIGLTKSQAKGVREPIIALPRTDSARELAEAYSAADVLFNPTIEDNFPTVNIEAEACGTPVITYDTGGCSETISLPSSKVVSTFDEAVIALRDLATGCKESTVRLETLRPQKDESER